MASTTWYADADARIAFRTSDSVNFGAGASSFSPTGLYTGYRYRTLLHFGYSFSGIVSISSAVLNIRTSTQNYVAFGSSPQLYIQRLTGGFSEGTSTALSTTNAVTYANQPGSTTTNRATLSPGTVESTWRSVDITALVQDALAAGTFYGLLLLATDETLASKVSEFYTREGGSAAYISVTYSTNTAPNAPSGLSPNSVVTGLTPTLAFTHSDPQGDALNTYAIQVSTDPTFASVTHWNISAQTAGISGNTVSRAYAGGALSRGSTYYWRACTSDPGGLTGPWSGAAVFTVASLPTATLTEPSASGRLGKTSYTGGSGWAAPRLNVGWSFSCPDGGTQQSYEVDVANDSAGSPGSSLYASGTVAGTATSLVVPSTLTEGSYYHARVRVTCSHGETSGYSGYFRVRTRWGVVVHRFDMGAAPTSLSISTLNTTTGASSAVVMEYATNTTTTTPATFFSTPGGAGLNRYFFYRTWLLAWGASPATSPSLDKLVLSYATAVLLPDKWTLALNDVADPGSFVYGTQSLKHTLGGASLQAYQLVSVTPNTDYVLSGRLKSLGNSGALIRLQSSASGGSVYVGTSAVTATQDWTRVTTAIWNSGANTEVYVSLYANGAAGTFAWYDAIKLEASKVVTPWTPSFLADAVVLDAGGLQIDAGAGGIFRLRGSSGGARDRVDLGAHGLKFGGDVELWSPGAGDTRIEGPAGVPTWLGLISPAGQRAGLGAAVSGDSAPRLGVYGDATGAGIYLGGGVGAFDTSLVRQSAGVARLTGLLDIVGPGGLRLYPQYLFVPANTTAFYPDAETTINGAGLIFDDGNNCVGIVHWFRNGTFNVAVGMGAGGINFRGQTYSADTTAGTFSVFVESNSLGARLGVRNNNGYDRGLYLMTFSGI